MIRCKGYMARFYVCASQTVTKMAGVFAPINHLCLIFYWAILYYIVFCVMSCHISFFYWRQI